MRLNISTQEKNNKPVPLYLWERVEFLNEHSEFRNSGEGQILKQVQNDSIG